jgi:hypothetical protein
MNEMDDLRRLIEAATTPRSPEWIEAQRRAVRAENDRRKEDLRRRAEVHAKLAVGKTMTVRLQPRVRMTGTIVEAWVHGIRERSASMVAQYGIIIETSAGCRNRAVVEKLPR